MSAVEMREEVHQMVDELDNRLLKAIHSMLVSYRTEEPIGYEVNGDPIYGSELGEALDQEVKDAESGNYITVEELAKRSKEWLKRTK